MLESEKVRGEAIQSSHLALTRPSRPSLLRRHCLSLDIYLWVRGPYADDRIVEDRSLELSCVFKQFEGI